MPEQTSKGLGALTQTTEKIDVELVYVSPGKDDGLLPISSLLSEMKEIGASSPLLSPLPQALNQARQVVDAAFDKAGFDATHIQQFGDWVRWMQAALPLAQCGRVLPELPPFDSAPGGAPEVGSLTAGADPRCQHAGPLQNNALPVKGCLMMAFQPTMPARVKTDSHA